MSVQMLLLGISVQTEQITFQYHVQLVHTVTHLGLQMPLSVQLVIQELIVQVRTAFFVLHTFLIFILNQVRTEDISNVRVSKMLTLNWFLLI